MVPISFQVCTKRKFHLGPFVCDHRFLSILYIYTTVTLVLTEEFFLFYVNILHRCNNYLSCGPTQE